jgi:hypothetical protein
LAGFHHWKPIHSSQSRWPREWPPLEEWPNCTQLLHSTVQWIVKQTVLQSRGFSRLPLEFGGNLKRYRKEKANSQALTASGALPKSIYNRFQKSLRHNRRGNQLVFLDLRWLAMYLQQVRPGAKQTRWSQLFFSFFTLSFHQIYLSTEIFVEEPAAPTSQARF